MTSNELPTLPIEKGKLVPIPLSSMCCPACQTHVPNSTDKFCRVCGMRILMNCVKCTQPVRPSDKYCPSCGARRWAFFEMWRHGILHRSAGFTLFTVAAVSVAWLSVYTWVKTRYHYH
ncbi:hypothetical protein M3Y97_00408300 [Aphelenchoides bicaudatus]|nr:hypothetical protein M3Y97_00408300 [Aphelenchoides bicaudatus]